MHVDLTKSEPEPDEPAGDELADATAPVPTVVEKEPVRLTAREEFTLPLKALGAAIVTGSPILARRIATAAWAGVRAASQTRNTTAAKPAPKKADEPAADSGEGDQEEKAAPPAKTTATAAGIGDALEQLVMGAFVVVLACAGGGGLLTIVWSFAAPYAGWIFLGLIVGWCLAAAAVAPAVEDEEGDTPVNDHENPAGEQGQEHAPETDPTADWARRRIAIRRFTEGAVAAGAAGYRKEQGRGATVDSMLAELQQKTPLPGWDRKRMIEFLELAGIPVREQVSFYITQEVNGREKKVKKNLPAVHVEDLAKELGKTPSLPPQFVPETTPGQHPHLASVPPLVEGLAEAPAEGSIEGPPEGRPGVA